MASNDQHSSQSHRINITKSLSYGPRHSTGVKVLLPLAAVLFWSIGLGSTLLIWLLARRIPGVSTGYLVVDEGTKLGSTQMSDGHHNVESTMRGMLIITIISSSSAMAMFPLMALGAFYVAAQWLDAQASSKDGPTPLQFGLVMQMCSAGTWDSVFTTWKYIFRHRRSNSNSRTNVSPVVYHALTISSITVLLHYTVKLTNLWLIAGVGSMYYSSSSRVNVRVGDLSDGGWAYGTRYNTDVTPYVYGKSFIEDRLRPTHHKHKRSYPRTYFLDGVDAIDGRGGNQIILIKNTTDTLPMAVIVRPDAPPRAGGRSWTAETIGMVARCLPVACSSGEQNDLICPEPQRFPPMPLPSFPYISSPGDPKISNASIYNSKTGERLSNIFNWETRQLVPQTNPSYAVIQLQLGNSAPPQEELRNIRTIDLGSSYVGTCEATLYNVEVSFESWVPTTVEEEECYNYRYSLTSSWSLMSEGWSTRLFGPIVTDYGNGSQSLQVLNYAIMNALELGFRTDTTTSGFSDRVSAEFARLCLGHISAMVESIPATTTFEKSRKLVSRYPTMGTFAFVGVVYGHALVAIILLFGIRRISSNSVIVDDPEGQVHRRGVSTMERQTPLQELLLVHLRLSDPRVVVAEHFSEPLLGDKEGVVQILDGVSSTTSSAGSLSARTDPVEMFGVESPNTMRIEVGLIDDREGRRRFGLKHRRNDRMVERVPNYEQPSFNIMLLPF